MQDEGEPAVREVPVVNPTGIHARPSHAIVSLASQYEAELKLIFDGRVADARSILSVMTLGATQGAEVRLEASGPQAEEALEAMAELFRAGFQEAG